MIFHRQILDNPQFLCVKRSQQDGGFWNLVVGTQENGESDFETIERETFEELGLKLQFIIKFPNCSFKWNKDDIEVTENSYIISASKVGAFDNIELNEENTEYRWCYFEDAYELLEKSKNKKCLKKAHEKLQIIYSFQDL